MADLITITPASGTTLASATITAATFSNVISTLFSGNEVLDGSYKYLQFLLVFALGFITSNYTHGQPMFSLRA